MSTPPLLSDARLRVDAHLRVCDADGTPLDGVFAIGDNATPNDGHRLPATAQVASQMAGHMAATLRKVGGGTPLEQTPPFAWKDHGSMVFIGDYRAMVDRSKSKDDGPRARLSGFVAWIVWRSYYVTLAMGWRNKVGREGVEGWADGRSSSPCTGRSRCSLAATLPTSSRVDGLYGRWVRM